MISLKRIQLLYLGVSFVVLLEILLEAFLEASEGIEPLLYAESLIVELNLEAVVGHPHFLDGWFLGKTDSDYGIIELFLLARVYRQLCSVFLDRKIVLALDVLVFY